MLNKKNIIIGIILLALLVFLGFWLLRSKNIVPKDIVDERQVELSALNKAVAEAKKTDADQDGISNDEENKLGTNSAEPDSDHDGILDYDEINLYKSDPIKADTDTDGNKDGYEVLRGYSPTGPGKL